MDKSTGLSTHYTYKSCSAMEAHAMKLPTHSFVADVNARRKFGVATPAL